MKWLEEKSKEQIYSELLKEMKYWFPEIPESSDRLDPVLRLLLGSFAHQIERLNQEINSTWNQTFKSLVRSLFVEGLRWPVPACTVMKLNPADKILELDSPVQFLYRDEKEEKDFIFSTLGKTKVLKAEAVSTYYHSGEDLFQLITGADKKSSAGKATFSPKAMGLSSEPPSEPMLYIGIDYEGSPQEFTDVPIFFHVDEDALPQLRWSKWFLCSKDGYFFEESSFCPGLHPLKEDFVFWGGLGKNAELFKNVADYFFYLPPPYLNRWEKCQIPYEVQKFLPADLLKKLSTNKEKLLWIKIKLPEKGDKTVFSNLKGIYFNCLLAINKKDLTFFKYTAGNQLLEVELPEESTALLSIDSVVDSNNRKYQNRLNLPSSKTPFSYITEERNGHMVLWFDFADYPDSIPNSISVSYSTTFGSLGNGIEEGKIQNLWERHPGIRSVINILPTTGGMPAKTQEELLLEISSLLRNRGRAVSFEEIENWARVFDPRVTSAECKNIIRKSSQGAFRCTQVDVRVKGEEFFSEDELKLFKKRLEHFLKARSLINVSIEVNIISD